MNNKLKVMIVDDSPVFRALLTEIVESDPQLTVVATAENPYEARDLIKQYNPDVLTLDIEMPKMNGVQFLKNLMRLRPMPVVMISTLTQHGADITLEALEIGAVDYFPKPAVENTAEMIHYKQMVNAKIKMAAGANVKQSNGAHQVEKQQKVKQKSKQFDLIAIGASTGGTEAVRSVLSALPSNLPPIVITQHISAMFTPSFAQRLDAASELTVRDLAVDSAPLVNGCAYVAPGDKHMVIVKRGGCLYCELDDRPPVNRHKPSVDVMFDAVAETLGDRAIGIILTGMGQDGAEGMLNMKNAGAYTIAQDEQSSVVWGMPRVAVEVGAVEKVVPLNRVPRLICDALFST